LDNLLTKPGPTAGSSESHSDQNLRSNPVCLEVAVTIRSLPGEKDEPSSGPAQPTREEARTVIVFDNGAVLRLASHFPTGQAVILSNHEGRDVVCRVVSTRDLPTVKGYMEVEFLEPMVDFWGIHKPAGQSNASAPSVAVVAEPPAITQPQVVSSEPPLAPSVAPPLAPPVAPSVAPSVAPPLAPPVAPSVAPSVASPLAPPVAPSVAPSVASALAPPVAPSLAPPPAPPIASPIAVPARVQMSPTIPEPVADAGNAPSFEDIAGLMPMSPPAIARGQAPESTPHIPVSRKSDESRHHTVEEARPFSPTGAAGPASELMSLSTTWGDAPTLARTPSTPNDSLGKLSSPYTLSEFSESESRGKSPLIIAGAAVILICLGTGLFFMHRRSSTAPSVVPVASASQPTKPAPRASTSVPTSAVIPQTAAEQAPPLSPAVSQATAVLKEVVAAPAPTATPTVRHQADSANAKQPDQVDVKQPDQSSQRPQAARDLKMVAPTVESRAGRLVDGSVPDIEVASAARPASGTPGGDLIPAVSRVDDPPVPPTVVARPSSSGKAVVEAKLISSTPPVYPPQARQSNIEGDVLVAAEIDATGRVVGAKATAGPVFLRQAAVDAVRRWKYEPATIDGRPSSAHLTLRIQFRLK
jgi:TonB family protein